MNKQEETDLLTQYPWLKDRQFTHFVIATCVAKQRMHFLGRALLSDGVPSKEEERRRTERCDSERIQKLIDYTGATAEYIKKVEAGDETCSVELFLNYYYVLNDFFGVSNSDMFFRRCDYVKKLKNMTLEQFGILLNRGSEEVGNMLGTSWGAFLDVVCEGYLFGNAPDIFTEEKIDEALQ